MKYQAVFFDLDGTLLDSAPDLAAAVNATMRDLGRAEWPLADVARFVGKGAENLLHRALTGSMTAQAESALFEQAMGLWKAHYTRINGQFAKPYAGVFEGLDAFKNAGLIQGVVTNKPFGFSKPLLEITDMAQYMAVIVGGDTCERKKPDPMPLVYACSKVGVEPGRTLFIGDSVNDALAASAAGIDCWLLPYGYNEGHPITEVKCERYIDTIEQAAQILLEPSSHP